MISASTEPYSHPIEVDPMIDSTGYKAPFTIFAGAGLSSPAPTSLPGWWSLNEEVLRALGESLEGITNRSGISAAFQDAIIWRRDRTPFLKPDLQAQLIEDQIGDAYFRALASVDSERTNAGHAILAELARQGHVNAIITTNFDCTIERALAAAGIGFRLFTSADDFDTLTSAGIGLVVVKVHGSSNRPVTMVDTLRQRLQGRPTALTAWMKAQFIKQPTFALGFSGDDLQYDPDYLGIRPSISMGARFHFLVQPGKAPSNPVTSLLHDFPDQVKIHEGSLPGWLFDFAAAAGLKHDLNRQAGFAEQDRVRSLEDALMRLRTALKTWATGLRPFEVINATTSLLAAAAQRTAADHLLRRTWVFYRVPSECIGPSYVRYLCNYGETLMRSARYRNPIDRDADPIAWKQAADQDPRQFFYRAQTLERSPYVVARHLLCRFLAGESLPSLGDEVVSVLTELKVKGVQGTLSMPDIDAIFSVAEALEYMGMGQGATSFLEDAYAAATAVGDEFRRAEAAWRLARNLSFDLEANPGLREKILVLTSECAGIASRLDIRQSDAGSALALTIAGIIQGEYESAEATAKQAGALFTELADEYGTFLSKRELVRILIGKGEKTDSRDLEAFDELSAFLQSFIIERAPGMRAVVKLELAYLACLFDSTLAHELATDAAEDGKLQGHLAVMQSAQRLLGGLTKVEATEAEGDTVRGTVSPSRAIPIGPPPGPA